MKTSLLATLLAGGMLASLPVAAAESATQDIIDPQTATEPTAEAPLGLLDIDADPARADKRRSAPARPFRAAPRLPGLTEHQPGPDASSLPVATSSSAPAPESAEPAPRDGRSAGFGWQSLLPGSIQ